MGDKIRKVEAYKAGKRMRLVIVVVTLYIYHFHVQAFLCYIQSTPDRDVVEQSAGE